MHTHTFKRTFTRAHIHTHIHILMHTGLLKHIPSQVLVARSPSQASSRPSTANLMRTHILTCTHKHTHTQTHTHTHTHMFNTHTHKHTQTHTHARAHTNTHIHISFAGNRQRGVPAKLASDAAGPTQRAHPHQQSPGASPSPRPFVFPANRARVLQFGEQPAGMLHRQNAYRALQLCRSTPQVPTCCLDAASEQLYAQCICL